MALLGLYFSMDRGGLVAELAFVGRGAKCFRVGTGLKKELLAIAIISDVSQSGMD